MNRRDFIKVGMVTVTSALDGQGKGLADGREVAGASGSELRWVVTPESAANLVCRLLTPEPLRDDSLPFIVAGSGTRLSMDSWIARRAAKMEGGPAPELVAIPFAQVRKLCGHFNRGRCSAREGLRCEAAVCPVLLGDRGQVDALAQQVRGIGRRQQPHDGDADRLIACDATGQLIDGDRVIAILASHQHRHGRLSGDGVVTPDGYVVNTAFSVNHPHPAHVPASHLVPEQTMPTIGDRLSAKGISWA